MAMARTGYSAVIEGDNVARAKANELPVSPKHSIEIARFIRGMTTAEAKAYLADVVEKKKAIPFKRFKRNVAHQRGLTGWAAGRYPVKAAEAYIRLLIQSRRTPSIGPMPRISGSTMSPPTGAAFSGILPTCDGSRHLETQGDREHRDHRTEVMYAIEKKLSVKACETSRRSSSRRTQASRMAWISPDTAWHPGTIFAEKPGIDRQAGSPATQDLATNFDIESRRWRSSRSRTPTSVPRSWQSGWQTRLSAVGTSGRPGRARSAG